MDKRVIATHICCGSHCRWTCDQIKGKSGEKNYDKPVNSSRLLEPAHLCLPAHSLTNHQPSCIGRNKRIWKYWIFFTIHFNVLQEPIKQTETICLSQGTSANKRERFAQDNCLATQSRTLIKLWLSSHSSAKHMFWRRVGQRAALEEEEEPPGFLAFCVLIGRKPPQTDVKTTFSRLQSPRLCICRTKVPMQKKLSFEHWTFFKKAHPSIHCCCSLFLFYKISSAWTKTICGYAFDLNGKSLQ